MFFAKGGDADGNKCGDSNDLLVDMYYGYSAVPEHMLLKGITCNNFTQLGAKYDEEEEEKTDVNQEPACAYADVAGRLYPTCRSSGN